MEASTEVKMDTKKPINIKQFFTGEIVQGIAICLVLFYGFVNFGFKTIGMTRDEGDALTGRVAAIESGMKEINASIRENSKDQDNKMTNMADRIINRMDKMNDDLKERIRENQPVRRPARD